MKVDLLLGLQWGDEGKGKIVDVLTKNYDIIARFQGGPNAGHTLEFDGIKHVLHTIPSGIFHENSINLIGNGVVIDPVIFQKEIEKLEPFDNNEKPIFLIESLKIFKPKIINNLHISCLLKDKKNKFYESIAFNVLNSKIGEYLMNYKKEISVLAELNISYKKDNAININIIDIII